MRVIVMPLKRNDRTSFIFFPLEKEQVSEVMVARTTVREAAEEMSGGVADMVISGVLPETAH